MNRRSFLQTAGAAALGWALAPFIPTAPAFPPNTWVMVMRPDMYRSIRRLPGMILDNIGIRVDTRTMTGLTMREKQQQLMEQVLETAH